MHVLRKYVLFFVVSLVVIFLAIQAAYSSLASLHYHSARAYLLEWTQSRSIGSEEDYNEALNSAEKAQALQPDLALYNDTLSEVIQWGAYSLSLTETEREARLRRALALTMNSLELRPSWAVSWMNAAYIKWQLNELDDEFYGLLERSNQLGRNSHEVNLFYVEFGFFLIDSDVDVYLAHRLEVERRLKLALESGLTRGRAFEIIERYKKENLVCSIVDTKALGVDRRLCG